MSYCIRDSEDGGQNWVEKGVMLMVRGVTLCDAVRGEMSTLPTDAEFHAYKKNDKKMPPKRNDGSELEIKPGMPPIVPGPTIPAKSNAGKDVAGKWSRKVTGLLEGMRKLAVGSEVRGMAESSAPAIVDDLEPGIKSGGLAPNIPTSPARQGLLQGGGHES